MRIDNEKFVSYKPQAIETNPNRPIPPRDLLLGRWSIFNYPYEVRIDCYELHYLGVEGYEIITRTGNQATFLAKDILEIVRNVGRTAVSVWAMNPYGEEEEFPFLAEDITYHGFLFKSDGNLQPTNATTVDFAT